MDYALPLPALEYPYKKPSSYAPGVGTPGYENSYNSLAVGNFSPGDLKRLASQLIGAVSETDEQSIRGLSQASSDVVNAAQAAEGEYPFVVDPAFPGKGGWWIWQWRRTPYCSRCRKVCRSILITTDMLDAAFRGDLYGTFKSIQVTGHT
jgi:hypothetical protein